MRKHYRLLALYAPLVLSGALAAPGKAQPSVEGEWEIQLEWPLQTVHMILLKSGKVLCIDQGGALPNQVLYTPGGGTPVTLPEPPNDYEPYCSGHAQLGDGKILIVGGGGGVPVGVDTVMLYDPDVEPPGDPWTDLVNDTVPDPGGDRWYPTATILGTGKVLLTAGRHLQAGPFPAPEDVPAVFDPSAPEGQRWTRMNPTNAEKIVENYPYMFQLTNAEVFMAGSYWFRMGWDPTISLDTYTLNVPLEAWSAAVSRAAIPGGSAVMYRPDKIMKGGGSTGLPALRAMYTIDMGGYGGADWKVIDSMNHPRSSFYLIVLPDGKVLAVGGLSSRTPELYDPDNPGAWVDMDQQNERRLYHSAAVLLPDARVIIAGGEAGPGPDEQKSAQIFKPPYLFDLNNDPAPRPVIDSAPSVIYYGGSFTISTQQAADITSVVLMRPGAATHSFDMEQRYVPLVFTASAATVTAAAPAHGYLAPPGYYMLFILKDGDRAGIKYPSEAKIVQLAIPAVPG